MIAFVVSAALAGAAGALFGGNFSQLSATKFDFNTSILILVFVVLGGLGNMRGSIISAAILTILPEALRQFSREIEHSPENLEAIQDAFWSHPGLQLPQLLGELAR